MSTPGPRPNPLAHLDDELAALRERHLYRPLRVMSSAQGPIVSLDDRRVISLSSNDYLGLSHHPRMKAAAIRAVEQYGEGERAHRTAFASLKHTYEKSGDRWVPKKEKGASDPRSRQPTDKARAGEGKTFGGIDYYGHTKKEFEQRAKELGITGYSRMRKEELVEAIEKREQSEEARRRREAA